MHKHRVARIIAGLLFIASLLFFLVAVVAGFFVARNQSLLGNWGPGWQSWLLVPVLISAFFSAVGLLVLGSVVYFMAKIENNLSLTRYNLATALQSPGAPAVAAAAAPVAVETPPTPAMTVPAAQAIAEPMVPAAPMETVAPSAEVTEVEAVKVEMPEVSAPPPWATETGELVEPPAVSAPPSWIGETEAAAPVDVTPEVESEPVAPAPDADAEANEGDAKGGVSPAVVAAATVAAAAATAAIAETMGSRDEERDEAGLEEIDIPDSEPAPGTPTASAPIVIMEPGPTSAEAAAAEAELPDELVADEDLPAIDIPPLEDQIDDADLASESGFFSASSTRAGITQSPRVEIANLDPETLEDELPGFVDDEPSAAFTGHLPGSDEAARISAEMASMHTPAPMGGDDFSLVKGVGPVYAQRLRAAGIATYADLASASDELLEELTDGNLERVIREDWRGQARQLSS